SSGGGGFASRVRSAAPAPSSTHSAPNAGSPVQHSVTSASGSAGAETGGCGPRPRAPPASAASTSIASATSAAAQPKRSNRSAPGRWPRRHATPVSTPVATGSSTTSHRPGVWADGSAASSGNPTSGGRASDTSCTLTGPAAYPGPAMNDQLSTNAFGK